MPNNQSGGFCKPLPESKSNKLVLINRRLQTMYLKLAVTCHVALENKTSPLATSTVCMGPPFSVRTRIPSFIKSCGFKYPPGRPSYNGVVCADSDFDTGV